MTLENAPVDKFDMKYPSLTLFDVNDPCFAIVFRRQRGSKFRSMLSWKSSLFYIFYCQKNCLFDLCYCRKIRSMLSLKLRRCSTFAIHAMNLSGVDALFLLLFAETWIEDYLSFWCFDDQLSSSSSSLTSLSSAVFIITCYFFTDFLSQSFFAYLDRHTRLCFKVNKAFEPWELLIPASKHKRVHPYTG